MEFVGFKRKRQAKDVDDSPEFFLKNLPLLMHKPLNEDCRFFLSRFHITDDNLINEIVAYVDQSEENRSLGGVVEILLIKNRLDILSQMKTFIRGSLEDISSDKLTSSATTDHQPHFLPHETDSAMGTLHDFRSLSNVDHTDEKNHDSRVCNQPCAEHKTDEQKGFLTTSKSTTEHKDFKFSVPARNILSVLLLYTEDEEEAAMDLIIELSKNGIKTVRLSDIEYKIFIDPHGALRKLLEKVDFIVPIVSKNFIKQAHAESNGDYLESQDPMNHRGLYQLCMNEYRFNRYLNFRVKPVLVPEFDRSLLKYELIFSCALRLKTEIPKLIRILRQTKEMEAQMFPSL